MSESCVFASTRDPDIRAQAGLTEGILLGSGAIVPIAHRTSIFELTPAEWADTRDLLLQARMARKTDGPIHGRPGADGHFGVPGERGAQGQFQAGT